MIYVDSARNAYGRMKMCHMLSYNLHALHVFAQRIGLKREWFQEESTPHYDICQAKRKLAIRHGAIEATREEVVKIIRHWRTSK